MEQRGEHQEVTAGDTGASEQVRGTAVKPIQRVERASQRALSTTVTACRRGADPFQSSKARTDELLVSTRTRYPICCWYEYCWQGRLHRQRGRVLVSLYVHIVHKYIHTYIHTRYGDGYCMVLGNLLMGASSVCN
jgi:hypothetical protein